MVPLKMRIYSEHLPDSIPITDYMRGNYDRMAQALNSAQVNTIDLNTAFLNSPLRQSEDPLFFGSTRTGLRLAPWRRAHPVGQQLFA